MKYFLCKKCFLSSKSAYLNDFWRSCDTEDWSNDTENSALITGINYILKYISYNPQMKAVSSQFLPLSLSDGEQLADTNPVWIISFFCPMIQLLYCVVQQI